MKTQKNIILLSILASLSACNNGVNNFTSETALNPLQSYISELQYTPLSKSVSSKSLNSTLGNQQSFSLNESTVLSNIQIAYYESSNCTLLNNVVTLNGPAQMRAGTYTSTDASNYALCSRYPSGCDGLLAAVQNAPAWSMQYTYIYTDGSSYQSVCMNNPINPIGKSAEFIANYTAGVAACTVGNSCGFSQAYAVLPLGWSTQTGSTGGQTLGAAITRDINGNSYVTGYTTVGISGQVQTGVNDYFVTKYSESGALLWTKQVGSASGTTEGTGIGNDANNNIYVTGYTNAGISGQSLIGARDYYIAKYSESGLLLWTKEVGTAGGTTTSTTLTTDGAGNSYITGYTNIGVSGQVQTGVNDYFVAKYSESGALLWTKQVGSASGTTRAFGIAVDVNGNSYITGYTNAGISGQNLVGVRDYFVAKYSESGLLLWTKEVGTAGGTTSSNGITADAVGNSYITGYTNVGISGQSLIGKQDYYIAKYSESGLLLWTREVGAAGGNSAGLDASSDAVGNSYITGSTNAGISGQSLTGVQDYFVAKYSESGLLLWTKEIGTAGGSSSGTDISSDMAGNSYITGYTTVGLSGQSQAGAYDYFVSKIPNQ